MVDAVLRNWFIMVTATEGTLELSIEGFVWDIKQLVAYFCDGNGILASMWATQIHQAIDVLAYMFGRVGLPTDVGKTTSMTCQPCSAIGGHYTESYSPRMTR